MRRSVLEAFPRAHISAGIVWVDMLPGDSAASAESSARAFADPRVRHFHDPQRRAAGAVAASLGWEGKVAWDIYLFYDNDSLWKDRPPAPVEFMHQLSWEPSRFRTGDALAAGLREAAERLTGARGGASPFRP